MQETKQPENPQAFPMVVHTPGKVEWNGGMTLRDYFAAQAIHESMRQAASVNDDPLARVLWLNANSDTVATLAYKIADAMLRARCDK